MNNSIPTWAVFCFAIFLSSNALCQRAINEGQQTLEYKGSFERSWKEFMPEHKLDIPLTVEFKLRIDYTPGMFPKGTLGSVISTIKRGKEIFINGERFTEKSMPKELWDSFRIDAILVRAEVTGPNGIRGYLKGNAYSVPAPDYIVQPAEKKQGWANLICYDPCWVAQLDKNNSKDEIRVDFKILEIENIAVYTSMSRFRAWYETRKK